MNQSRTNNYATTTEYRVIWKRTKWEGPQSRKFERANWAERFAVRLQNGEGEYGPLEYVRIDQRDCQTWAIGVNRVKRHG